MLDYPPEQLWPLYDKLPEDLKEAIFSEKTADIIYNICTKNGLEDEKISGVAKYTGYVFLGLLPPEEFQKALKEDLNLKQETAKKIGWEIERLIFFPLKSSLEVIYKIEITSSVTSPQVTPPKLEKKPTRDIYREPIE